MISVGVVIATYGDRLQWAGLAQRAMDSVSRQTYLPDEMIWHHDEALHLARNNGAKTVNCDRTIFLDADDELDPHYIEEMLRVEGDIIQPSTLGVVGDRIDPFPVLIPEKNLIDGNYIVIGAQVHTDLFWKVGGFRPFSMYEDWDLWIRMVLAGAKIGKAPDAIYRIHVSQQSRNNQDRGAQISCYNQIRNEHLNAWTHRGI